MIKCVIIDDDEMSRMILREFISKDNELNIIAEFENPLLAINFVKDNAIDLLFLDIEMPEMTGIEFIELLDKKVPRTIFTTSHTNFAIDAFNYNVSGYLVKPFEFKSFCKAVLKAKEETEHKKNSEKDYFFIKDGTSIVKINVKELTLVECIGDYVTLYTANDKRHTFHSTMKALEGKFNSEEFIRVHRSYIIRIDKIQEIEDDCISFGSKQVPIGKTYKNEVYARFKTL